MAAYSPNRGDLIWINFDPQAGHEQAGRRPAVVLSERGYNKASGLAIICPITNRAKGYPFEVALPDTGAVTGVVLADQLRNLDWRARRAAFISVLDPGIMIEIAERLRPLLALDDN